MAIVTSYLIFARRRMEDGASNKTHCKVIRPMDKVRQKILFFLTKSFQERMGRPKTKRPVAKYNDLDKYVSTGKISNAIRGINGEAKGVFRSLTDNFDKKTVLGVLREKDPEPWKSNLS